jgi:hypothetical protein
MQSIPYSGKKAKVMKKWLSLIFVAVMMLGSCGPKPYYETHEGKKKLKHYNRLQFGQRN